jgi:predicted phosphodiesterase
MESFARKRLMLSGCDLIVHAGDVGAPTVLEELRAIAPVGAVPGNNDKGQPWVLQ